LLPLNAADPLRPTSKSYGVAWDRINLVLARKERGWNPPRHRGEGEKIAGMTADPRIGTQLGKYRILELIGRGGMGVVYLAEDSALGRMVALKVLAPEIAEDEKLRERFVRESRLAASLEHSNIVPIYEAGEADGQLYIAMRYVKGTDLKSLLRTEGPLPPAKAEAILRQVGSALDAAHAKGLVHRDVKSANVLLAREEEGAPTGEAYLSDFGLTKRATSLSGLTATGQFLGTLDYAAPEQLRGEPIDARSDIYSLGCVLYECLTGEVPFKRDHEAALVYAHLKESPPSVRNRRPDLPPAMDRVIARAMAKDPKARFQRCAEMAQALQTARAPGPNGEPGGRAPHRRRNKALAMAMAGFAGLAAVIAIMVVARGGGRPAAHPTSTGQTMPNVTSNLAVRIDAATNKVASSALLPSTIFPRPPRIAVGEGGVWIVDPRFIEGDVWHVDPARRQVVATIEQAATTVAVGDLAVWLAGCGGACQVDPATNLVVRRIRLPGRAPASGLAVGAGAVWVSFSDGQVSRIDLKGETAQTVTVGTGADAVAVGDNAVWVSDSAAEEVYRLDAETGRLVATISVPGSPKELATGAGSVWVANINGVVTRIDAATNAIASTIPVGKRPSDIAFGAGAVWVTNGGDGTVSRIDPDLERVTSIQTGGFPEAIAVEGNSVWLVVLLKPPTSGG
jgi:hypothetical protein